MNHPVAFLPTAAEPTKGIDQAFQETLELLEWPRVCDHLASFASTRMGRYAARNLVLPETLEVSRQRLAETPLCSFTRSHLDYFSESESIPFV